MMIAATACGGTGDANADLPVPDALSAALNDGAAPDGVTLESISKGRILFNARATCSACHGANGRGGQLAPNLADDVWLNSDGTYAGIIEVIEAGVLEPKEYPGLMLPRGGLGLSDEEVSSLAAFIWSLGVRG
jgi:mono/diheme cytochrome c family protein